jgi:hypothetical protein
MHRRPLSQRKKKPQKIRGREFDAIAERHEVSGGCRREECGFTVASSTVTELLRDTIRTLSSQALAARHFNAELLP